MQNFRKLTVWQKGHRLVLAVYETTRSFPTDERYGLTSQMRRAAVSIPSNIAEGCGRGSDADFARFCQVSMGSASEVSYQLLLSRDLGFVNAKRHAELKEDIDEIQRMLASLLSRLRQQS